MNGSSGIVPTVDLATNNNNGVAYPVYPFMNGGYGNSIKGCGGLSEQINCGRIQHGNIRRNIFGENHTA